MLDNFIRTYKMPQDILQASKHLMTLERVWSKHSWATFDNYGNAVVEEEGCDVSYVTQDMEFLVRFVSESIQQYYEEFEYSASSKFSALRFNRYKNKMAMKEHSDHIYTLFDGTNRGVPVCSVVGLINKPEKGGKFLFDLEGVKKEALTEEGDLVIFPSFWAFRHEVTPVEKGVRDSFVSWTHN